MTIESERLETICKALTMFSYSTGASLEEMIQFVEKGDSAFDSEEKAQVIKTLHIVYQNMYSDQEKLQREMNELLSELHHEKVLSNGGNENKR